VTPEEGTELVQPGVGNDVNEYAAPGWMDPDRKAFRKVARGSSLTFSADDVGQHQLVNAGPRGDGGTKHSFESVRKAAL
jgi:hypothetical protein